MTTAKDAATDSGQSQVGTPAGMVLLVDELPMRREAYLCLLEGWGQQHNLSLRAEGFETYKTFAGEAVLFILSGGCSSIAELRLRAELVDIDLRKTPLLVISDRDEAGQVTEAIALGARGYLPTKISAELALRTLTFVLGGGDFFPPSALTSPGDGNTHQRRREMLD